jgi:hypothetical protein
MATIETVLLVASGLLLRTLIVLLKRGDEVTIPDDALPWVRAKVGVTDQPYGIMAAGTMSGPGILLIVACLVVDMAMPSCPGAFRFEPTQSIEGAGSRAVRAWPPRMDVAPLPGRGMPQTWRRSQSLRDVDPAVRLPVRRELPRAALIADLDLGSLRPSDDG